MFKSRLPIIHCPLPHAVAVCCWYSLYTSTINDMPPHPAPDIHLFLKQGQQAATSYCNHHRRPTLTNTAITTPTTTTTTTTSLPHTPPRQSLAHQHGLTKKQLNPPHLLILTTIHNMPRVYPPLEGRQANPGISPSLVESVAGFSAGIVSTLVVHPFDMIKTRLQSVSCPLRHCRCRYLFHLHSDIFDHHH